MTYAITTKDNPYNPFKDFDNWYAYDMNQSLHPEYVNSCALLARVSNCADSLSDAENNLMTFKAIQTIIKNDPLDVYRMVQED